MLPFHFRQFQFFKLPKQFIKSFPSSPFAMATKRLALHKICFYLIHSLLTFPLCLDLEISTILPISGRNPLIIIIHSNPSILDFQQSQPATCLSLAPRLALHTVEISVMQLFSSRTADWGGSVFRESGSPLCSVVQKFPSSFHLKVRHGTVHGGDESMARSVILLAGGEL